jgi:hypothetical protein
MPGSACQSIFHPSTHLVLEIRREVEHLLRKAVERLSDTRLEVSQTLVSCCHVLVVVGQVWGISASLTRRTYPPRGSCFVP